MNYGRSDLQERTCKCGCGQKFKPKHNARVYFNNTCNQRDWEKNHPEKGYKKLPNRNDMKKCIELFYNAQKQMGLKQMPEMIALCKEPMAMARLILSVD